MSDYLVREIDAHARVSVRLQSEVVGASGNGRLDAWSVLDGETQVIEAIPAALSSS